MTQPQLQEFKRKKSSINSILGDLYEEIDSLKGELKDHLKTCDHKHPDGCSAFEYREKGEQCCICEIWKVSI